MTFLFILSTLVSANSPLHDSFTAAFVPSSPSYTTHTHTQKPTPSTIPLFFSAAGPGSCRLLPDVAAVVKQKEKKKKNKTERDSRDVDTGTDKERRSDSGKTGTVEDWTAQWFIINEVFVLW